VSDELEPRIKRLIVDALMLEDVKPEEIETEAPLFVEGLGLDSIDALELALAIHKEFGVKTSADDERNREYFYSVASLAQFIRREQAKTEGGGADTEAGGGDAPATEAEGSAPPQAEADLPSAADPTTGEG
jgi:acyl carrier protein